MSKYRSREAPPPGASVSQTHPGYFADHIKKVERIRDKWYNDYGHFYLEKNQPSTSQQCPTHGHGNAERPPRPSVPQSQPVAYLRSLLEGAQPVHSADAGTSYVRAAGKPSDGGGSSLYTPGYTSQCECPPKVMTGQPKPAVKANMDCDYPTPGNVQHHHVVKDHVTAYSESFGHHSYQFNRPSHNSAIQASGSVYHCHIPCDKSTFTDSAHLPRCPPPECSMSVRCSMPHNCDTSKRCSPPQGAQNYAGDRTGGRCGGVQHNGMSNPPSDLEQCAKCLRKLCVCIPRRRQDVPTEKGSGLSEEMPSWPPQIWLGPSYGGNHRTTEGGILRLRHSLSKDLDLTTPMNRMYDAMKRTNFYDGKAVHGGPNSSSCVVCIPEYEAQRGSWFDEQLRKGNVFTTGDTQAMACAYIKDKSERHI